MELAALPETFAATREALHSVAERIVAPARKPDNEIALVRDPGRVRHAAVRARRQAAPGPGRGRRAGPSSETGGRARAARRASPRGRETARARALLPGGPPEDARRLDDRSGRRRRLADFYDFAADVLRRASRGHACRRRGLARSSSGPSTSTSLSRPAREVAGLRANYGASPGRRASTPSPTSTSVRGRPSRRASSGTRAPSPAPRSATPISSRRRPGGRSARLLRRRHRALRG